MSDAGERTGTRGPRLADAVARMFGTLAEGLGQRVELFGIELSEERARLVGLLLGALAVAVLALLGLLSLNLLLVLAWWRARVRVVALLSVLYLGCALGLALWLRARLRSAPTPFAATIEELRADADALRGGKDKR